jgi:hypothetical protein
LKIPDDECASAMAFGGLAMLTVVKKNEIDRTIGYIRKHVENVDAFWIYFNSTWMNGRFGFSTWNVTGYTPGTEDVRFRTNSALERYNRTLKDEILAAHPNIFTFVETIRASSLSYERKITRIQQNIEEPPERTFVKRMKLSHDLEKALKE